MTNVVDSQQSGSSSSHPSVEARAELVDQLRRAVDGEVSDSSLRRAEYSTDASNYRVVPQVVVIPKTIDDARAAIEVTHQFGVPLTTRGAGTSCAGNSIGPGVVIDFSRHVNRVLDIDPTERIARVEPGVIMGSLQAAARPTGYGSDQTPPPKTGRPWAE